MISERRYRILEEALDELSEVMAMFASQIEASEAEVERLFAASQEAYRAVVAIVAERGEVGIEVLRRWYFAREAYEEANRELGRWVRAWQRAEEEGEELRGELEELGERLNWAGG